MHLPLFLAHQLFINFGQLRRHLWRSKGGELSVLMLMIRCNSISFGVLTHDQVSQASRRLLLMVALHLAMLSTLHALGSLLNCTVHRTLTLLRNCHVGCNFLSATVVFETSCHVALRYQILLSGALIAWFLHPIFLYGVALQVLLLVIMVHLIHGVYRHPVGWIAEVENGLLVRWVFW